MIEKVLPSGVAHAETFGDVSEAVLFPAEVAVVSRAVPKRRREFATVRHCARQALGRLGVAPAPLLPGERGALQWPTGVVGSMTHCAGYRAAAVARRETMWTLGIDAEPHDPLPVDVLPLVSLPQERDMLTRLAARQPDVHWDRLLFCVKEAVYKAWFPLARCWLDFSEAMVTLFTDGRVVVHLLVEGPVLAGAPVTGFTGRWLVDNELIVVGVAMPVGHPDGGSAW